MAKAIHTGMRAFGISLIAAATVCNNMRSPNPTRITTSTALATCPTVLCKIGQENSIGIAGASSDATWDYRISVSRNGKTINDLLLRLSVAYDVVTSRPVSASLLPNEPQQMKEAHGLFVVLIVMPQEDEEFEGFGLQIAAATTDTNVNEVILCKSEDWQATSAIQSVPGNEFTFTETILVDTSEVPWKSRTVQVQKLPVGSARLALDRDVEPLWHEAKRAE